MVPSSSTRQLIVFRGVGTRGHRPPQYFSWGLCPCNFEPWHLLIKAANDELAHMTHKEMCEFINTLVC